MSSRDFADDIVFVSLAHFQFFQLSTKLTDDEAQSMQIDSSMDSSSIDRDDDDNVYWVDDDTTNNNNDDGQDLDDDAARFDDDAILQEDDDTGRGYVDDNWIEPVAKMRLNDDNVDSNEFDDDMVSSKRSASSVESSYDQLLDDDRAGNGDDGYNEGGTNDDAATEDFQRNRYHHRHRNLKMRGVEGGSLLRRWL